MSRFLCVVCILSLLAADVIIAQRGGPGVQQDIKILKQFDKSKDGWLNSAERKEARTHVTSSSFGRPPFPMRAGGLAAASAPGERIAPADVKTYPNSRFYDDTVLRTLFLTFEETNWEKELQEFHGTDVDVPAAVMVDGKSYHNVGVRFRGMSSYGGVPEGRKRSLNLMRFGGPMPPPPVMGMGGGTNLDRQIATKWLDWKTLGPVIEQYRTLIEADVKRDTRKLESYEAFADGVSGPVNSLKTFAASRLQYLSR